MTLLSSTQVNKSIALYISSSKIGENSLNSFRVKSSIAISLSMQ
ncbi:Uncharacterised protein [Clostridioides difficile]|nr:Uncharacterised protein [Clostridioides difficile]